VVTAVVYISAADEVEWEFNTPVVGPPAASPAGYQVSSDGVNWTDPALLVRYTGRNLYLAYADPVGATAIYWRVYNATGILFSSGVPIQNQSGLLLPPD
jgi:hypothetical protein